MCSGWKSGQTNDDEEEEEEDCKGCSCHDSVSDSSTCTMSEDGRFLDTTIDDDEEEEEDEKESKGGCPSMREAGAFTIDDKDDGFLDEITSFSFNHYQSGIIFDDIHLTTSLGRTFVVLFVLFSGSPEKEGKRGGKDVSEWNICSNAYITF